MIDEQIKCACGLTMEPTASGSPYKKCANCDEPHDEPSERDHIFKVVWAQRIARYFPEKGAAAA